MTPKMKDTIPEGWHTYTLGEIYTERKEAGNPELPILTVSIHSGVSDGALDEEEIGKTVKRIADKTQYKTARAGDLVFNMMRAWQGAIGVARSDGLVSPAYIVATPNEELVYPLFMDYYMKSPKMVGIINRQSYGVTDFRKRLYWDSFAPIKCTLPSIAEQKKIVEILSEQDRSIELEEELTVNKLKSKNYLMQQLLTGAKRLTGSCEKWETQSLGELFTERTETKCENLPLLAITGSRGVIPRSELDIKDNSSEDKTKYLRICKGDIGYNTMRMWQGVSAYSEFEGIVSPAYTILKPCDSINAKYFAYLFKLNSVVFMFYRHSQGLVDDTRNLKYDQFGKIKVRYPKDIREQNTIATVLSDIDREIELLQESIKLEKQKKKALMQLLLTGTVRVNNG